MKSINKIVKESFNKVLKEYMDDDPWYDGYNGMAADDARYDEMMDTMPPSEEMYNQEMPMQQAPMDGQMANGMKRPHKVNLDGTLNENKDMKKKQIVRLTESDLHRVIKESVTKILKENDDFKAHGYKTTSNLGGHEVEISPSGDAARFRFYGGEPTDWLEIEFDGDGVAYVETERGKQRLCDYMRY